MSWSLIPPTPIPGVSAGDRYYGEVVVAGFPLEVYGEARDEYTIRWSVVYHQPPEGQAPEPLRPLGEQPWPKGRPRPLP